MIKLVKKDLKLFFSNKRDMLLIFILPIIIITLFASVFGEMDKISLLHSTKPLPIIHVFFKKGTFYYEAIIRPKQFFE